MKAALTAVLALLPQAAPEELKPGLLAEFYALGGAVEDFPALPPGRKADVRRIDLRVDHESTEGGFGGTALTDGFSVRWTGLIRIPAPGKYVFYTESDDGSRLSIGDVQVVDNAGVHGMEERSGEIELKAGDFALRLEMFENVGSAGCRLSWEGPALAKEIVPARALLHRKDAELDK